MNSETLKAWGLSTSMCFGIKLNYVCDCIQNASEDIEVGQFSLEELEKQNIKDVRINKTIVSWVIKIMVQNIIKLNEIEKREYHVNDLIENW